MSNYKATQYGIRLLETNSGRPEWVTAIIRENWTYKQGLDPRAAVHFDSLTDASLHALLLGVHRLCEVSPLSPYVEGEELPAKQFGSDLSNDPDYPPRNGD